MERYLAEQAQVLVELAALQRANTDAGDPQLDLVEFASPPGLIVGWGGGQVRASLADDRFRLRERLIEGARGTDAAPPGWRSPSPNDLGDFSPSGEAPIVSRWAQVLLDLGEHAMGLEYRGARLRYRRIQRLASSCRVTVAADESPDITIAIPLDVEDPLVGLPFALADAVEAGGSHLVGDG